MVISGWTPAGTTCSRKRRPFDIAKYATVPPMANSGTAEPPKKYAQRRSLTCNPGAMNAQNWYIHTGEAIRMPTAIEILNCMNSESNGPVTNSVQLCLPPVASAGSRVCCGNLQYGALMKCQICG